MARHGPAPNVKISVTLEIDCGTKYSPGRKLFQRNVTRKLKGRSDWPWDCGVAYLPGFTLSLVWLLGAYRWSLKGRSSPCRQERNRCGNRKLVKGTNSIVTRSVWNPLALPLVSADGMTAEQGRLSTRSASRELVSLCPGVCPEL